MLLEIILPGAPFWATASCKYCGLLVANLVAGSLKRPLHPAGDFLRPTLASILYHIILWVKKIVTLYIVVLSELMSVRGTNSRHLTIVFVKRVRGYLN